ncbi:MAG: hypothetical protein LUI07_09430 [Lachnospiraceae bacterium]|nr:hypothetical protein [Lachnospiraceae bacterium]
MKKRLVLGLLTLSAASLLCGFDSAETAESVLEKANEASSSIDSTSSNVDMNCDITINIGDGTTTSSIAILATAGLDIQAITDPFATAVNGTFSLSTFGLNRSLAMEMYLVTNDEDGLDAYVYTEDSSAEEDTEGSWVYSSDADIDIQALIDASDTIDYGELSEWGLDFELASESAEYDGIECYLLTTVLDSFSLNTVLEKAEELTGEDLTEDEEIDSVLEMLDGLEIAVEYYIDTDSYLPTAMHIDLNNSDLSALNDLVTLMLGLSDSDASSMIVELIFNDVSMDYTFSYNDVDEITVPEEALEAAASGEAESLGDLYDALEDEELPETEILSDDESGIQLIEG